MKPDAGVPERLAALRERIAAAAARAGRRPEEVRLLGVSKGQPSERVVAAVCAGLAHVGENYVQEAREKLPRIREELEERGCNPPCFHFIGGLQRNKVRFLLPLFSVVETLDREALGDELERRAAAAGRRLRVLVEVNISGESSKGGVAPEALPGLLAASTRWRHLDVEGLMAIPEAQDDPERARPDFARLRALRDGLRDAPGGAKLGTLSMGMSGDFEVAIEEGATEVRVGTALFGPRER